MPTRGELQNDRYMRTGCPKLASRKQMKRVMRDRTDLTSYDLYREWKRIPGPGRTRGAIRNAEEQANTARELREIARVKVKAAESKAEAKIPSLGNRLVGAMTRMFNRRGSRGA